MRFLEFLKAWNEGTQSFSITTSGSTGTPKTIQLERSILEYSAEQSYQALGFNRLTKIFNCIPTDKIGGFMNWVRAAHCKLDCQTVNPSADPMQLLPHHHNYSFVSLVPYQVGKILESEASWNKLNQFEIVLVGGAALPPNLAVKLQQLDGKVYESYGMTETYSHIAIRNISKEGSEAGFELIGDAQLTLSPEKTVINGTVTRGKLMEVNDVLEWNQDGTFRHLGRRDHVINTGGYKVQAEKLEQKILQVNQDLNQAIMVVGFPSEEFGQKVVLLVEGNRDLNLDGLDPYEQPKVVKYNVNFVRNSNGKVLRNKTVERLNGA